MPGKGEMRPRPGAAHRKQVFDRPVGGLTGYEALDIKAERNSRGYNWEIKVSGAKSIDEALAMLSETDAKLKAQFAPPEEKPVEKAKEEPKKAEAECSTTSQA